MLFRWIREQTNLNGISGLLYLFKKSVEFGSHNYFESLMKKEKSSRSGETQILMFTTIVKSLINDMEKMLQIDENSNFTRLCLSSIFFKINKENLHALVKSKILKTLTGIKRFNWSPNDDLLFTPNSYDKEETIGLELYQLYLALKQFDSFETEESFEDVSTWFNFEFWLEIIKYNGFMRITKAVLLDNFEPISEYEQITSSAVDTIFVLEDYMKNFNWPEEQKNILFSNIVENICDFCAFYVNRLINHEQCKRNEDILKKYCRTINNLVHIYNNHESYLVGTDAILIENFQRKNKKLIERLLKMVATKSAEKLFVLFGKKEVTELNKICENIQFTIKNSLDANESSKLLEDLLWFYLSEMIINLITKSLPTEKPPSFYARLGDTLHELTIRFVSTEVLGRNEKLKEAQTLLKLHGKSDNDLIQQFHKERLMAQQSSEENFITVNCYFLENKLKIKVLNAKVDTANSLNPYVNIHLLPESIFVDCPEQTTKNLRDPNCLLFDESFEL